MSKPSDLVQGTLDLLILRTLRIFGSQQAQGIACAIRHLLDDELVEHGALYYPALERLEERGWISAKWGISTNNRKACFYSLTSAGHHQLVKEITKWNRLTAAIGHTLESEER